MGNFRFDPDIVISSYYRFIITDHINPSNFEIFDLVIHLVNNVSVDIIASRIESEKRLVKNGVMN